MADPYCPDAGDLVWLDFDPQAGREQRKRRPALILSPRSYNAKAGLCVACPITSRAMRYPFEAQIPEGGLARGVVLADQVRSISWDARRCERWVRAPESVVAETRRLIKVLIGL